MNQDFNKILENVLTATPWDNEGVIRGASSWLSNNGVLSDFHKNTLVVGVLMESKSIKDTDFFIKPMAGSSKGIVHIYLYMTKWFMWFGNKAKLANKIINKSKEFLSTYEFVVKFKPYLGKQNGTV